MLIPNIEIEQEKKMIESKKGKSKSIKVKNECVWINFIIDILFERR